MASLSKIKGKRGTTYRVDFYLADDPSRKTIRLGKMAKRQAVSIKSNIESLIAAKITGTSPDLEVSHWVAERDNDFHAKLVAFGLATPRTKVELVKLGKFLERYIDGRDDIKPSTRSHLNRAKNDLIGYFGADKLMRDITPGDADEFRRQNQRG